MDEIKKSTEEVEKMVFHELHCLRCDELTFRVVILRIEEGTYALSWICTKCGASQPGLPIERSETLKGLIQLDVNKKL